MDTIHSGLNVAHASCLGSEHSSLILKKHASHENSVITGALFIDDAAGLAETALEVDRSVSFLSGLMGNEY